MNDKNEIILLNQNIEYLIQRHISRLVSVSCRRFKCPFKWPFGLYSKQYNSDTFVYPRNNKDKNNEFGNSIFELFCIHGIDVLNGCLFGDMFCNLTCTANNARSVVDYQ